MVNSATHALMRHGGRLHSVRVNQIPSTLYEMLLYSRPVSNRG